MAISSGADAPLGIKKRKSALDSSEWRMVLQDSATFGRAFVSCMSLALFESRSLPLMSSRMCSGSVADAITKGTFFAMRPRSMPRSA